MWKQSSKVKKFAALDEKYFQNLAREQKSLATPVLEEYCCLTVTFVKRMSFERNFFF
jgi:hypothetical protein